MSALAVEIRAFVEMLLQLPDEALADNSGHWKGENGWQDYSDNLNDIAFLVSQQLRQLTVAVESRRASIGPKVTEANRILAQHQGAYRDFIGLVAGVRDDELDLTPFEKKWSLRSNIVHLTTAECWSQGPRVLHAIAQYRSGDAPKPMPIDGDSFSGPPNDYGPLTDMLARFDVGHNSLIQQLSTITDEELNATSVYWEDEPVDVRFRLYRFAWHIRSHTMQADKIRIALGHRLTDMDRHARLLYHALGEAEGVLIGAGESQSAGLETVAASIKARVQEMKEFTALLHS